MSEPLPGPAPLLVLLDSTSRNRFLPYILEILDIEGYAARDVHDLAHGDLESLELRLYDIVLLTSVELSPAAQDQLAAFVQGGGNLIALRPQVELATRFGLVASDGMVNRHAADRYIAIEHDHAAVRDMPCDFLQYHGQLDLYTADGAEVLAWVAGDLGQATGFAAVSLASHGDGAVAVFAYDLCTTVVRQHQGRPENSSTGAQPDADGDGRWIPNDLFVNQLDARLKFIPQADLHQDLLVRLLNRMSGARRPLPRIWYFPNGSPCVAYFNGDSDGMDRDDYDTVVAALERFGGKFTVYLMEEHHGLIDRADERALRERGHAFGHHVILEFQASLDEARAEVERSLESFRERYGYQPLTNRGHCLIWPGWTEMADYLASGGVRMDQNFIPRRFLRHGYLNGSGLPVRFIREDGTMVDIYEQNTHITDDGSVEVDKFLLPGVDEQDVLRDAFRMLDECAGTYHGVFQASFHPRLTTEHAMWLLEALAERCWERDIPMVGGDEWVRFNDARRQVRIDDIDYDEGSNTLSFTISGTSEVQGLTVMLPGVFDGKRLERALVGDTTVPFERKRLKGTVYGLTSLDLAAGDRHRVTCQFVRGGIGAVPALSR